MNAATTNAQNSQAASTATIVGSSRLSKVLSPERGWIITVAAFAAISMVPFLDRSLVPTMTLAVSSMVMAYGWNLVGGFLGELSFGHMMFWGIGAYGAVIGLREGYPLIPWTVGLIIITALVGVGVAFLVFAARLKSLLTVAIFTLVLGEIALNFARANTNLGQTEGLYGAAILPLGVDGFYWLLVAFALLAGLLNLLVAQSRFGRQLLAIRDDQVAAKVAGVNILRRRCQAYALSAAVFALGGIYQGWYLGAAHPITSLASTPLFLVVIAVFVGGAGSALGPLVGSVIIFGLGVVTRLLSSDPQVSLYAQLAGFAIALVVLRLVLPRLGGLDIATATFRAIRRRRAGVADGVPAATDWDPSQIVDRAEALRTSHGDSHEGVVISGLSKSFGRLEVLRRVDLLIRPGEVVGILGPNGAGKSTLCNLISGIEPVTAGTIMLNGVDITGMPARHRTREGIGRSFQTPRLFSSLSLSENLSLSGDSLSEDEASSLLKDIGIQDAQLRRGNDSQFFVRRLTEVAKATLDAHSVLLLDEPLAGLTREEQALVLALARRAAATGVCVAIVEHLIPVIAPAVDRMIVLDGGRVIANGPPSEVLKNEAVVEAYLGSPTIEEASS